MVDIPDRLDDHAPVFIYGVEGEQIEEENDAYNDLRFDLGRSMDSVLKTPFPSSKLRHTTLSCQES